MYTIWMPNTMCDFVSTRAFVDNFIFWKVQHLEGIFCHRTNFWSLSLHWNCVSFCRCFYIIRSGQMTTPVEITEVGRSIITWNCGGKGPEIWTKKAWRRMVEFAFTDTRSAENSNHEVLIVITLSTALIWCRSSDISH